MRHTLGLFCVLLLCSQVFADLTWPVQKSGTLSAGNPLNGTFRTNLKAGATLLVEHTRPVRVCLQRFVQLPDISQWSSACTWYKEFGHPTLRRSVISLGEALAVNDSAPFTANNDLYNWGVQLQNTSFNDSATVMLSGDTCPEGQAFNGTDCTAVQPLAGAPAKPLLNVGDIVFYSFYVGYGVKSISVAATTSDGKATFNSYLRLNGVPSSFVNDTSGAATVSKGFPQPGLWYYALHLATAEDDFAATEVTVTLTVDVCAAGSFGTNCNTTVNPTDDSSLVVANLKLDGFVYFSVTPSATTPLYVSFQSSKLAVGISVYGSIGNLPSPDNYLIKGCNQQYCHSVTSIKLDNSTNTLYGNETWIFGITTADNDTDVGAWINSVCAPTCDSPSGECIADGPDAGLCTCEDSYIGIDCTIPVGLPSQYIVLIIIAALVIASAVIGFIAWAYMRRRRRVHYEKVV